jgi:hypothetical protein
MKIKKSFNKKKKFFPAKKIEQFLVEMKCYLYKNKFQWKLLNMIIVNVIIHISKACLAIQRVCLVNVIIRSK